MVLHRVYWTKQKVQKKKRWTDGFMSVGSNGGLKLMNEERKFLDSDFKARAQDIAVGDEIEFTNYLVTVEELQIDGVHGNFDQENEQQPSSRAAVDRICTPRGTSTGAVEGGTLRSRPSIIARAGPAVSLPRPVAGRNLLRRKAPSLHSSTDTSLHKTLVPSPASNGTGVGWVPSVGHHAAHPIFGAAQTPFGFTRALNQDSVESECRFGPAYFKQMKRNKIFGYDDFEDCRRHDDAVIELDRSGENIAHEESVCSESGDAKRTQVQQHRTNNVLALLGLEVNETEVEDESAQIEIHETGTQSPPAQYMTSTSNNFVDLEANVSFPSRFPSRKISFPSRVPVQVSTAPPNDANHKTPSHSDFPSGGAIFSAVYSRKTLKTKRWASGFVVTDGGGHLTLVTDEHKFVESASRWCALLPDAEVEFDFHIALIEELVSEQATLAAHGDMQTSCPLTLADDPKSRTCTPSAPDGKASSSWPTQINNESTPTTVAKKLEHDTSFSLSHQGDGSGFGGFFALRNAQPMASKQGAGIPRGSGWSQISKVSLPHATWGLGGGALASGSLFTSPRKSPSVAAAGGDCSWSTFQPEGDSLESHTILSQGEKIPEHLGLDQQVQKRPMGIPFSKIEGLAPGRSLGLGGGGIAAVSAAARAGQSGIHIFNTLQLADTPTQRKVEVKDNFRSFQEYKMAFVAALEEEVTLMLRDTTLALFRSMQDLSGASSVQCKCGISAVVRMCNKDNSNKGRSFFTCRSRKCSYFKWVETASPNESHGACANLTIDTKRPAPDMKAVRQHSKVSVFRSEIMSRQPLSFKRQRSHGCNSKSLDNTSSFIVRPLDMDERRLTGTAKNDLWVVSSSAYFSEDPGARVIVCRSVWFGFGSDGCIELLRVCGANMQSFSDGDTVYILRGPNIQGEWDMMENLKNMSPAAAPLVPFLLSGGSFQQNAGTGLKIDFSGVDVSAEVARCIAKFSLNDDQAAVVKRFAHVLQHPGEDPPVILVHGVFGSGKSTLLVAIVLFFVSVIKAVRGNETEKPRLLISSATNVAIDNILLGLLDRGYEEFVRVGCLKRIAKPILKYTLRENSNDDKIENDSLKELNEILKSTRDATELRQIRAAIAECRSGKLKDLKRTLGRKRVVGVTCASSGREALVGQRFDICILDECSQFIEPLSLLPISRFQSKILIAAGDPMQLPPTISTPSNADLQAASGGERAYGDLSKTLFTRLVNCGVEPTMLRTQYRCHPTIGSAASDLFYGGQLINGTPGDERCSLIQGIPPLLFVDTDGSRETMQDNGSFVNVEEAHFCAWMISSVIVKGLESSQIGVICAYKAQVNAIRIAFEKAEADIGCSLSGVQVSTVDAFQGGEKDVIVVSLCRTESLGFLKSHSRMNVAVTRARRHLIFVGCGKTLPTHGCWKELIDRARLQPCNRGVVGARELQMHSDLKLVQAVRYEGKSWNGDESEESDVDHGVCQAMDGRLCQEEVHMDSFVMEVSSERREEAEDTGEELGNIKQGGSDTLAVGEEKFRILHEEIEGDTSDDEWKDISWMHEGFCNSCTDASEFGSCNVPTIATQGRAMHCLPGAAKIAESRKEEAEQEEQDGNDEPNPKRNRAGQGAGQQVVSEEKITSPHVKSHLSSAGRVSIPSFNLGDTDSDS